VAGYKVYRTTTSGGPYTELGSNLDASASFTDNSANSGVTYYYVVTAVDSLGNESAYSNQVSATVP
jgi:fibronectin type 3 domain-containing protein